MKTPGLSGVVGEVLPTGGTSALSAIQQAAMAFDHFGFVLEANPAAQALFDENLYVENRRLMITDPDGRRFVRSLNSETPHPARHGRSVGDRADQWFDVKASIR